MGETEQTIDLSPIDHLTTTSSTSSTLAVMILALLAGVVIALALAHIFDRGVNPIRDAVSDYGAREYKNLYRLMVFWLGLAGLLASVMLGDAIYPKPTGVILLLLLFAATRWTIALFPVDLPGEEATSVGRSHTALATTAFVAIAACPALLALHVADDQFWSPHSTLLQLLAGATLLTLTLTGVSRWWVARAWFGLFERAFYLAFIAWLAAISIILLSG